MAESKLKRISRPKPGAIAWWHWLPLPWRRWRTILAVEAADEIPARLPAKAAVLVTRASARAADTVAKPGTAAGSGAGHASWIAFDCPCRRGHRVMLNLDRRRRPAWTVKQTRPLTIAPSVNDFTIDNTCHYFIRKGRIQWVPAAHGVPYNK